MVARPALLIELLVALFHLIVVNIVFVIVAVLEKGESGREEVAVAMRASMALGSIEDAVVVGVVGEDGDGDSLTLRRGRGVVAGLR